MERVIEASTEVHTAPDRACAAVLEDPAGLIEPVASAGMVIEVGAPLAGDTVVVPLSWRAAGLERLFPIFEGEVEIVAAGDHAELHLRGHYVVPLGAMGRFGDGLVGRRVARRTAASIIEDIAERISGDVLRRPSTGELVAATDPHTTVRDLECE